LGSTFFGLTSNIAPLVRKQLFKTIHDIVFHGKGGFDYQTVYNMPIWLRKFTFQQIQDHFDDTKKEQEEAIERRKNAGKKSLVNKDGKVNTPAFSEASKPYKGKTSYK
jgi:hypothetical protein